jgi:hypothetical protein
MPAKSKKQQMAAGAALAAKRGKRSKSSLKGASRQMARSMRKRATTDGKDEAKGEAHTQTQEKVELVFGDQTAALAEDSHSSRGIC